MEPTRKEADRQMIMEAATSVSFGVLDKTVADLLRGWLLRIAAELVSKPWRAEGPGDGRQSGTADTRRLRRATLLNGVGTLFISQGLFDDATPLFRDAVAIGVRLGHADRRVSEDWCGFNSLVESYTNLTAVLKAPRRAGRGRAGAGDFVWLSCGARTRRGIPSSRQPPSTWPTTISRRASSARRRRSSSPR